MWSLIKPPVAKSFQNELSNLIFLTVNFTNLQFKSSLFNHFQLEVLYVFEKISVLCFLVREKYIAEVVKINKINQCYLIALSVIFYIWHIIHVMSKKKTIKDILKIKK